MVFDGGSSGPGDDRLVLFDGLRIVVLTCSGIVAGVFFAVTVSVVPALAALPAGRYVEVHRMLGKGYHPTMPLIVMLVLAGDLALAFVAPATVPVALPVTAMVLQVGVQAVSHLGNERLNRSVRTADPDVLGPAWTDPRQAWRRWHLIRTALALAVFVINGIVAVIPPS